MSLIENGWILKNNIFSSANVKELLTLIDNEYPNRKKLTVIRKAHYEHPLMVQLCKNFHDSSELYEEYKNLKLSKIWFVETNHENSEPNKLPYIPHFDKRRFLKLMVYLCDVGKNDGPFTTSNNNVTNFEERRKQIDKSKHEEAINTVESQNMSFKPILAKAGDGIIFDTNCPHFASPVGKGGKRKILRLDFENHSWNKHLNSFARNVLQSVIGF